MNSEDEKIATEIANGVEAWKVLTHGQGPVWEKFNKEQDKAQENRDDENENRDSQDALPPGHPEIDPKSVKGLRCPFSAMSRLGEGQDDRPDVSSTQRPSSLPTPPTTHEPALQEDFSKKTTQTSSPGKHVSPPPSASGSFSKCPIRMLDERPPEEVAEYFETHKHEIPRSHEICVKRFQSNAQSIRQLDAKYGSLVNMIQGLGVKHQSLLPTQEDEEDTERKSMRKVEKWANNVGDQSNPAVGHDGTFKARSTAHASHERGRDPSSAEGRVGYFDRPLKEIRVGESPSRPWGISVPVAAAPSGETHESEAAPMRSNNLPKPAPQRDQAGMNEVLSQATATQTERTPQMVFTGPVFIGYAAEQAASLIEKCGWDPQGPQNPQS